MTVLNCVAEFCKVVSKEFLLLSENCGGQFSMSAVNYRLGLIHL